MARWKRYDFAVKSRVICLLAAALSVVSTGAQTPPAVADISPAVWPKGEYEKFMAAQNVDRTKASVATGRNGAVTVAYNGIAPRAGLEALTMNVELGFKRAAIRTDRVRRRHDRH